MKIVALASQHAAFSALL